MAQVDPGFPIGGRGLPKRLRFENFVCRNDRIWTLGGRAPGTPPRSANDYVGKIHYVDLIMLESSINDLHVSILAIVQSYTYVCSLTA